MDTDDDFMGDIEFDLSPEQGEVVNRAINLVSSCRKDEFAGINPLIEIMQWWQANKQDWNKSDRSAESRLVEACRSYINAHTA